MTRKQKRLSVIAGGLAFLGAATGRTFYALGQKASYFYMPADLTTASAQPRRRIRLGGPRREGNAAARPRRDGRLFGDRQTEGYQGDLHRHPSRPFPGRQGVITEGSFGPDGVFLADSVLAKHDEN